jgi:hypothetical protein
MGSCTQVPYYLYHSGIFLTRYIYIYIYIYNLFIITWHAETSFVIMYFHFSKKNLNFFLKFLQLSWGKKMPSNFVLLRHQAPLRALGQVVNSTVKQILRTLDIVSSWHWEKLTFTENNLLIAGMVKVLLEGYLSKMGSWEFGKEAACMHACKI